MNEEKRNDAPQAPAQGTPCPGTGGFPTGRAEWAGGCPPIAGQGNGLPGTPPPYPGNPDGNRPPQPGYGAYPPPGYPGPAAYPPQNGQAGSMWNPPPAPQYTGNVPPTGVWGANGWGPPPPPPENPVSRRKRLHKRVTGSASTLLLIQWGAGQVLALVLMIAVLVYLLASGQARSLADALYGSQSQLFVVGMLPALLADIVALLCAPRVLKIRLGRSLLRKGKSRTGMTALAVLSSGGFAAIATGIYYLVSWFFGLFDMGVPGMEITLPKQFDTVWILSTLYICLLGPILEELIFRGVLLKYLRPFGDLFAVIVTAVLFAVFHMNPVQLVMPLLFGLLLSYVTIKSESLLPAIFCHIFNNSMSVLSDELAGRGVPYAWVFNVVFFAVGLVCLLAFCVKNRAGLHSLSRGDTSVLTTRQKLRATFSAGQNIALLVIYAGTFLILLVGAAASVLG